MRKLPRDCVCLQRALVVAHHDYMDVVKFVL